MEPVPCPNPLALLNTPLTCGYLALPLVLVQVLSCESNLPFLLLRYLSYFFLVKSFFHWSKAESFPVLLLHCPSDSTHRRPCQATVASVLSQCSQLLQTLVFLLVQLLCHASLTSKALHASHVGGRLETPTACSCSTMMLDVCSIFCIAE